MLVREPVILGPVRFSNVVCAVIMMFPMVGAHVKARLVETVQIRSRRLRNDPLGERRLRRLQTEQSSLDNSLTVAHWDG